MAESLPIVLVPGLTCTARLYAPQIVALWRYGAVTVADHRRDADIKAIAARILKDAPPRFALAGLSFGGYIAFEMMRQAPARIAKLALLDTSARPDTPEQTAGRKTQIEMAQTGRYGEIADLSIPRYLHRNRQNDPAMTGIVRQMIDETGPEAFVRQLQAIMSRPDSRPLLGSIRLSDLGAGRRRRSRHAAGAQQGNRRRHRQRALCGGAGLRTPVDGRAAGGCECGAGAMADGLKPGSAPTR